MHGTLTLSICAVGAKDNKKSIGGKTRISGLLPFGGFSWLTRLVIFFLFKHECIILLGFVKHNCQLLLYLQIVMSHKEILRLGS